MKKPSFNTVILYGMWAFIFLFKTIFDATNPIYGDRISVNIFNILCTIITIVGFIICLKRYLANKEK